MQRESAMSSKTDRGLWSLVGKAASWGFLALSVGLFVFVLWSRFGPGSSRGEWQNYHRGRQIAELEVAGTEATSQQLQHPSLIYFYDPNCRPCNEASESYREYVRETAGEGAEPHVRRHFYLLGPGGLIDPDSLSDEFPPDIEIFATVGHNPSLGFVQAVPMFVTTDSTGTVAGAYVGVPDRSVFGELVRQDAPSESGIR